MKIVTDRLKIVSNQRPVFVCTKPEKVQKKKQKNNKENCEKKEPLALQGVF